MRRVLVVVLTFLLVHSSVAFATDSLLESARRATQELAVELAQTQADPQKVAEIKRIATDLGAGKHVAVTLTSGKTLRGRLQAIDDDHFVLLPDQIAKPMEVAYGDVEELGPTQIGKGWKAAKVVMWVGVAVGVGLAVGFMIYAGHS